MKEITRIHLARTPFNVEIDAKKALEKYLEAIQRSLANDDDTMNEIEARIVEILTERHVAGDKVITTGDVEAIESRLGAPSDFAEDDEQQVVEAVNEKRLMRNTERGLLGGVLAGIADYFGINVMWPRLIAIILTLVSFGAVILVYAVLWLVIPAARTAAEKLQMRGEPVTLAALKSQASEKTLATPERSKPLVIVLRIFLGLMFTMMGVGAIVFMILAIFVREPLFASSLGDFMNGGAMSILAGAYVAAIIAGLLFVALMALAAYASFAWTVNKKLLTSAIILIVLGLSSFVTAIGLGVNGASQVQQRIEQQKTTETISNITLSKSLKQLAFNSASVPIEYHATDDRSHIDIQYLRGQQKPSVTLDGGVLSVTDIKECLGAFRDGCFGYEKVVVYGPALDTLTLQEGSLSYYPAAQADLAVDLKSGVDMDIEGAVDELTITTPQFCTFDKASLQFGSANAVNVNGKQMTHTEENRSSCLYLNTM